MAVHLNLSIFLQGLQRRFVAKVRLRVIALLKEYVAQVEVAVCKKMTQLDSVLVSCNRIVLLLERSVCDAEEKENLTQLLPQIVLKLLVVKTASKVAIVSSFLLLRKLKRLLVNDQSLLRYLQPNPYDVAQFQ
jgi:hypothetical protein